jgi:hypothetical protein
MAVMQYDPEISWLVTYPKESKSGDNKGTAHPCLLQYHSQKPSYGNSQNIPQLMNGIRKCDNYIQWNFIQP